MVLIIVYFVVFFGYCSWMCGLVVLVFFNRFVRWIFFMLFFWMFFFCFDRNSRCLIRLDRCLFFLVICWSVLMYLLVFCFFRRFILYLFWMVVIGLFSLWEVWLINDFFVLNVVLIWLSILFKVFIRWFSLFLLLVVFNLWFRLLLWICFNCNRMCCKGINIFVE